MLTADQAIYSTPSVDLVLEAEDIPVLKSARDRVSYRRVTGQILSIQALVTVKITGSRGQHERIDMIEFAIACSVDLCFHASVCCSRLDCLCNLRCHELLDAGGGEQGRSQKMFSATRACNAEQRDDCLIAPLISLTAWTELRYKYSFKGSGELARI